MTNWRRPAANFSCGELLAEILIYDIFSFWDHFDELDEKSETFTFLEIQFDVEHISVWIEVGDADLMGEIYTLITSELLNFWQGFFSACADFDLTFFVILAYFNSISFHFCFLNKCFTSCVTKFFVSQSEQLLWRIEIYLIFGYSDFNRCFSSCDIKELISPGMSDRK